MKKLITLIAGTLIAGGVFAETTETTYRMVVPINGFVTQESSLIQPEEECKANFGAPYYQTYTLAGDHSGYHGYYFDNVFIGGQNNGHQQVSPETGLVIDGYVYYRGELHYSTGYDYYAVCRQKII